MNKDREALLYYMSKFPNMEEYTFMRFYYLYSELGIDYNGYYRFILTRSGVWSGILSREYLIEKKFHGGKRSNRSQFVQRSAFNVQRRSTQNTARRTSRLHECNYYLDSISEEIFDCLRRRPAYMTECDGFKILSTVFFIKALNVNKIKCTMMEKLNMTCSGEDLIWACILYRDKVGVYLNS